VTRTFQKIPYLAYFILCFTLSPRANASLYVEVGTSFGTLGNAQAYFNQAAASASNTAFLTSLGVYLPVTSEKRFFHLELGVQNRFLTASTQANAQPLALGTTEVGARLQVSRFYAGGGYAPVAYVSKSGSGFTSLHVNPGASAYFFEGGLIWRVIPEFQIALSYARETLKTSGGVSNLTNTEYGLRFRFPFDPGAEAKAKGATFDGFRYPFGFMK
jgi:hypothetical protein